MKKTVCALLSLVLLLTACVANTPVSSTMQESSRPQESGRPQEPTASTVSLVTERAAAFTDIPESAYYADAAAYCFEHGLISGTGKGRFSPDMNLSRGMLVTILWRNEGSPAINGSCFSDVKAGSYYETAISWAAEKEIVSGYGGGRFGPEDPITREQLAVILYRYADYQNRELSVTDSTHFADNGTISDYAQTAVSWARDKGIASGKSGNRFDPKGTTTRAEAATMLYRYLSLRENEMPEKTPTPTAAPLPTSLPYDGTFPQHEPYGQGVGVNPGRVVWDYDPASVSWTNQDEHWWEVSHFDEDVILRMVRESIMALTGEDSITGAWAKLADYQPGQKIAIKCNMNGSDSSVYSSSNYSYTNPVLLKALVTSLTEDLGAAPSDITAYDVSRTFPQYMTDLCPGVNFVGRVEAKRSAVTIQWSTDFGGGPNYLPTCVTEADYLINLANLKGHSYGITLCGKNHFGSFINDSSPYVPMGANLHQWLTSGNMDEYSPLVDFMLNPDLGGKTILYMLDAIICARSEGSSMTPDNTKWQSAPFNGGYTASLFVSQDPVAIDSVGADFLSNEPMIGADLDDENYLHEAGRVTAPPSGTRYNNARNLGAHEHWNNSTQKLYSRNLGESEGIELVAVQRGN